MSDFFLQKYSGHPIPSSGLYILFLCAASRWRLIETHSGPQVVIHLAELGKRFSGEFIFLMSAERLWDILVQISEI